MLKLLLKFVIVFKVSKVCWMGMPAMACYGGRDVVRQPGLVSGDRETMRRKQLTLLGNVLGWIAELVTHKLDMA